MSKHADLYNTNRWKQRSLRQRKREPLCCMCAKEGRVTLAAVADHVVPHHGNPELFWHGELQSVCESHHNRTKQSIERIGYDKQATDADGYPTDALHPFNKTCVKTKT